MSMFPEDFYNNTSNKIKNKEIPLLKDYAIDLETGELLYDGNNNAIIVSGLDAVIVQSWRKIRTPKFDVNRGDGYFIYGKDFGSLFHKLLGKGKAYGDTYAFSMLEDCLVDNVYVTAITSCKTKLVKSAYTISYTMETIYGNADDSIYVPLE